MRFDGYCFRFASGDEVETLLEAHDATPEIRREVAQTIQRYLVPRPLKEQPDEVAAYSPYCGENSEPGRHITESWTTNPQVMEQPGP